MITNFSIALTTLGAASGVGAAAGLFVIGAGSDFQSVALAVSEAFYLDPSVTFSLVDESPLPHSWKVELVPAGPVLVSPGSACAVALRVFAPTAGSFTFSLRMAYDDAVFVSDPMVVKVLAGPG